MVTQNRKSFIVRSGRSFGYSVPVRPFRSDRLNWFGRSISRLHSHECLPSKYHNKNRVYFLLVK